MPIYFGHAADSKRTASTALRAQNINLLRAAPSSYNISFVPDIVHPVYSLLVNYLFSALLAVGLQEECRGDTMRAIPRITRLTPFKIPSLAISILDNNMKVIDKYITDGYYQQTIRRQTLLLKDNPTLDDVQIALRDPSVIRDCFVPWRYVNLNAMLAFFVLQKIATLITMNIISPVFATNEKSRKRQKGSGPSSSTTEDTTMTEPTGDASTKKWSWSYDRFDLTGDDVTEPSSIRCKPLDNPDAVPVSYTFDTVLSKIILGGLFFPFVTDLCRQDKQGPLGFITARLFRLLGSSTEACRRNLEVVRSGWGVLSKTDTGDQLAHFFRTYELSLQGQASFYPIFTGSFYEGAVIVGECFDIVIPGNTARPRDRLKLLEDLRSVEGHYHALQKIGSIINGASGSSSLLIPESLSSTSMIRDKVLSTPLTQDNIAEIHRLAYRLRFSEEWAVNPSTLKRLIDCIAKGELPPDAPISPAAIATSDIGHAAISCFGRSCPSFLIPSGRELSLRNPMPAPKMETVVSKGRGKRTHEQAFDEFEQTVQVRMVSWTTACNDLDRVRKDGVISVVTGQQARAGQLRVYRGQARATLWEALSGIVHSSNQNKGDSEMTQDIGDSAFGGSSTKRVDEIAETDLFAM